MNQGTYIRGAPNQTGRPQSATLSSSSQETHYYQHPHSSSSPHPDSALRDSHARPQSRPGSASQLRVPVKIQFHEPRSGLSHPSSSPKTRWELTLNLLPSTKTWELCHHAASHISREFSTSLDNMTFEVRDIDGHVLEEHDSISTILPKGAMVFLTECTPASTHRPPEDLSLEPGCIQEVHPTTSSEGQVPPPRKLPFTSVNTNTAIPTAQTANPSRSPLAGCLETANRESRTAVQEVSPPLSLVDGSGSALRKKRSRPSSRASTAKRSRPASRRPETLPDGPGTVSGNSPPPVHTVEHKIPQEPIGQTERPGVKTRSATAQSSKIQATEIQQPPATEAEISNKDNRCMGCRNKKRQCDGSIPTCGLCKQSGRKCIYPKAHVDEVLSYNKEDVHHYTTNGGQLPTSAPTTQDAATQVLTTTQDVAVQTVETNDTRRGVEMQDRSMNTFNECVDAAVEPAERDNRRLPYSQSLELVSWTMLRYDEQLKKAANILRTSNISREDYRDKAQLAAHYLLDLEGELRQMCEKALTNML